MISLRNIGKTMFGEVAGKGLGFLTFLLIIRFSDVTTFAEYTILFATGSIIYAFLGPPVNRIFIIEGESLGMRHYSDYLSVLMFSVAILIIIGGFISAAVSLGYLLSVLYAGARLLGDFGRNSCQRDKQFGRAALLGLIRAALWLALVSALTFCRPGAMTAVHLLLTNIVADICIFACFFSRERLGFPSLKRAHLIILRRIVSPPLIYVFAYNGILALFGQVDIYLLKYHASAHDLAAYASAYRFYGLLLLVVSSTNAVYLPTVAALCRKEQLNEFFKRHRRISLLFSGAVIIIATTAGYWMPVAVGSRYPEAVLCFQVLAISSLASFRFSPHGSVLMRQGRYVVLLSVLLIVILLTFPVRYWLVQSYGNIGAAGGYLFAFVVFNSALAAISSRTTHLIQT